MLQFAVRCCDFIAKCAFCANCYRPYPPAANCNNEPQKIFPDVVESGGFLRYIVDISRNLRLVDLSGNLRLIDLSGFPRFYFRFRFRAVYYKVFLLIKGGGK